MSNDLRVIVMDDNRRELIESLFRWLDYRMNDVLCDMKPGYDDSIVGFNEAWDVMRRLFHDVLAEYGKPDRSDS